MNNFLVIINSIKSEAPMVCRRIEDYIQIKGGSCQVVSGNDEKLEAAKGKDCAIVLGGDGTLLQASRELISEEIPLIGVNLGHLGFLADASADAVEDMIDRLMSKDFVVEKRMMLEGIVYRGDKEIARSSALNDIVISKNGIMGILDYKVFVNEIRLNSYKADGLIVSTPTGSTAYNMSAGGPLVKPSASLIVMTPICPHTLNTRSIVLDKEDEIEIEICQQKATDSEETGCIYYDGDMTTPLNNGDRIVIKKSENSADIIKLDSRSFLEVLRRKLNNNEDSQA